MGIKQKIYIFTSIIILIIFLASQIILHTSKTLDESFLEYKEKAVKGKTSVLTIEKELNYISRCSRDIMLGNSYDKNIAKIKNSINKIKINFQYLEQSIEGTLEHNKKLQLLKKSELLTVAFLNDALEKMNSLKARTNTEKYNMYLKYKLDATPLAVESRKYFEMISKMKTKGFDELTERFHSDMKTQKDFIAVTTIMTIFAIVGIMVFAIKIILNQIKTKNTLKNTENLLYQYKDAIDITNIVSKTDLKGIITYVNDEFCKVSQYSREELIGKPHNIVRSKDIPKKVFKELWDTIENKKVWSGHIKNTKKDGSFYYVDTTILPILDKHNNISEYIAIRKDITDIFQLNIELKNTQEEILNKMGMIAETRSEETGYHVKRVAEYCKIIATHLGMNKEDIELLYNASALHDIGKVGTPDDILHKPGKLTDVEFEIMKSHTTVGYHMLKDTKNKIIKTASLIAYEHHEKYDGTGYPKGLKGEEIHIYSRITALADVFDALGEDRSYKKGWALPDIIEFINEQKGKHFDPAIVDIFNDNRQEFLYIRKKFRNKDFDQ
ncbi:MAG: HD domain-containing protein [Campylobacterota bacterium]|nr:HD domain-containing protein [Campylobacterota bacterium]